MWTSCSKKKKSSEGGSSPAFFSLISTSLPEQTPLGQDLSLPALPNLLYFAPITQ